MRAAHGILLLILAILLSAPELKAQELPFRHHTTRSEINPLPKPAVTALYQDRLGFVWLSSYGVGPVRYDGQRMETYAPEDSVDTQLFGMVEDGQGRLWAIGEEGVIVSELPLADYPVGAPVRFTTGLDGVNLYRTTLGIPVNVMVADSSGAVWIGTTKDGMIRYLTNDRGALEVDTVRTGLHPDSAAVAVISVATRRDGSVWASLKGGRLIVFEGESLAYTAVEPDAPCSAVEAMHEDSSGALWLVCASGELLRFTGGPDGGEFVQVGEPIGGFVTSILEATPGKLWIGSLGAGVVEVDMEAPYRRSQISRQNGLLDMNVWGLMRDREGNFWIAQNGGLSRLKANYRAFTHYTGESRAGQPPDLPATDVTVVQPDTPFGSVGGHRDSVLVVGTSDGLAFIARDGTIDHLTREQGFPSSAVLNVCTDAAGSLWVTTRDGVTNLSVGSVSRLPAGMNERRRLGLLGRQVTITSYGIGLTSSCNAVTLPAASKGEELVPGVCFSSIPISCIIDGQWYVFGRASGLTNVEYWLVTSDSDGYLYVGPKAQGLYRSRAPVDVATLRARPDPDSESPGRLIVDEPIFELVADSSGGPILPGEVHTILSINGVLWASTHEEVATLEGEPLRVTNRLGSEQIGTSIFSMAFSPVTNTLWIGSSGGLAEIDPLRRTLIRKVTKADGLLDNETWGLDGVAVGADGTVYHGSAAGLSLYRPHLDRKNDVRPLVALREANLSQDGAGHNELNLRFAALSFADERVVRYKTRLTGFDQDWSSETAEASIRYTNLPAVFFPREYTFEVLASNGDGYWTEQPLTYALTIEPAWWLRWWAFLLYGVLLGASVYVTHRVQRRRVIRKEREQAALRERELRAEAAEHLANYLQADNDRKTQELEQARGLQLSMLPRSIPLHRTVEVAASMQTATEVGGDYYDFAVTNDDLLTFAIGDATGHGVAAGTMVTAVKSLWNAFSREANLEEVMRRSNEVLRSMHLPRLYMALAFGRVTDDLVELVGTGMPPALIYRAETGDVEELSLKGLPLGSPGGWPYRRRRVRLSPGDMLVLMSDGFPELKNASGTMLGYDRMASEVAAAAAGSAEEVVSHLTQRVKAWSGGEAPHDDVTFVVIRAKVLVGAVPEENGLERSPHASPVLAYPTSHAA